MPHGAGGTAPAQQRAGRASPAAYDREMIRPVYTPATPGSPAQPAADPRERLSFGDDDDR